MAKDKKKKEERIIDSEEKLKAFGIIREDDNDDVEIDGDKTTGGKDTTVDTHWPTQTNNTSI